VTSNDQGVLHNNGLFSIDISLSKKIDKFTWTLRFNNMFKSINPKESFTLMMWLPAEFITTTRGKFRLCEVCLWRIGLFFTLVRAAREFFFLHFAVAFLIYLFLHSA
jgi:hypothetical protein